jgi:hypothetical protein
MSEVIRPAKIVTARKDYYCMAWENMEGIDSLEGTTFAERRAIVKARNNYGKILKGQKCHFSVLKQDGIIYDFRAIPEIHAIMVRLNWYVDC